MRTLIAVHLINLAILKKGQRRFSNTDVNEIQDEEGVKSVAPPLTAHTCHAIVSYGVAAHSSWPYKWRHRGDFWILLSVLRYWPEKGEKWAFLSGSKLVKNGLLNAHISGTRSKFKNRLDGATCTLMSYTSLPRKPNSFARFELWGGVLRFSLPPHVILRCHL